MITTLLLDLDDTLLDNDIDHFLPTYLASLGDHMSHVAPPEVFTRRLLQATQGMIANTDPQTTLKQAFSERFYPSLNTSEDVLLPEFENFYTYDYPLLRPLTRRRAESQSLVERSLECGYEVVIATNPLFPEIAIKERLAWAGVPAEAYSYSLITSYETFHFAKPNMAYYAEILGRLGRPPHQAAMVGDSLDNDLKPARALGMAAFHVSSTPADGFPGGPLQSVLRWLKERAGSQVDTQAAVKPESILARLKGHLAALLALTSDLDPASWSRCPGEGEWGPGEIACHLRDVEIEVNLERIGTLLNQSNPFLSGKDTDRWAEERVYVKQDPVEALNRFTEARKRTITLLEPLKPQDWAAPARHALLGPTSLAETVSVITEHDVIHLAQIRNCLRQ